MKTFKDSLLKLKTFNKDILRMKSISEIINRIPMHVLEKIAFIILVIWVCSPILVMVRNVFMGNEESFRSTPFFPEHNIFWHTLLEQIGLLGCLLGGILFVKSVLRAKDTGLRVKEYLARNIFPLLLFLMLVWSIISCLNSDNIRLSFFGTSYRMDGLYTYFAYAGIFCCAYAIQSRRLAITLLKTFAFISVLLSCLMLINAEPINRLLGLMTTSAVFNNTNHFGYYLCLASMCIGTLFITEKKSWVWQLIWIISFGILTAALIINDSFGPILAVSGGLIFSVILTVWVKKKYLKQVLILLFVFIAVTLLMSIFNPNIFKEFGKLNTDMTNILEGSEDAAQAGSKRWPLWTNGFRFITERPLFGYGPDNLGAQYAAVPDTNSDRPHNEIIQFAASLGIPAALLYISALLVHFIRILKNRKQLSIFVIGIFCAVITYLISSLFGNTMYYTTPFFFMILALSGGLLKSPDFGVDRDIKNNTFLTQKTSESYGAHL